MDETGDFSLPVNANVQDDSPDLQAVIARMKRQHFRTQRAPMPPAALREIPDVGRYMPPTQNSYAAHRELVDDASLALGFSAKDQPAFDVLCAAPNALAPMLAVFRNALMSQFFLEHAYAYRIVHLQAIARYAGSQLNALSPDGKGAQALYLALLKRQNTPLWRMPSVWFKPAERPQQWALLPLEQSPFSDAALALKPPAPDLQISDVSNLEIV